MKEEKDVKRVLNKIAPYGHQYDTTDMIRSARIEGIRTALKWVLEQRDSINTHDHHTYN